MSFRTTYAAARARLAELLNRARDECETVVITRRDHGNVAVISADELRSLEDTAQLLRSQANAQGLSRRPTQERRLVYRVVGDRIDFLQVRYHY